MKRLRDCLFTIVALESEKSSAPATDYKEKTFREAIFPGETKTKTQPVARRACLKLLTCQKCKQKNLLHAIAKFHTSKDRPLRADYHGTKYGPIQTILGVKIVKKLKSRHSKNRFCQESAKTNMVKLNFH